MGPEVHQQGPPKSLTSAQQVWLPGHGAKDPGKPAPPVQYGAKYTIGELSLWYTNDVPDWNAPIKYPPKPGIITNPNCIAKLLIDVKIFEFFGSNNFPPRLIHAATAPL